MAKRSPKATPKSGKTSIRAGRVAILGRPNVGKSTLLNTLVGEKVAIATSKPQTTRHCILGVFHGPNTQIAFVDTPGLHRPKTALGRILIEGAKGSLPDVDAVILLTDSLKPEVDTDQLEIAKASGKKIVLVINKIDRLREKEMLLPALAKWSEVYPFAAIVPISALKADGLKTLIEALRPLLTDGRMYDDDFLTDRPLSFLASELIREAALRNTKQEVPHGIAVVIENYEDLPTLARIQATLVIERPSHKKIVIGSKGSMLKKIGTEARIQIEHVAGKKVYLELWVKVLEDWTDHPGKSKELMGDIS